MYIHKQATAYNMQQVAYPVGINKDSYYLQSYFKQDIETLVISVEHKVVKNMFGKSEELFSGSAKECYNHISNIVETEGEWIRDKKLNYVHNLKQEL